MLPQKRLWRATLFKDAASGQGGAAVLSGGFSSGRVRGGRMEGIAEVLRGGGEAAAACGGRARGSGRRGIEAGAADGAVQAGAARILIVILRGQVLGGDAGHVPGPVVSVVLRGGVVLGVGF
ncbi:MAG: hypothetical protein B7Z37_23115 [Verrucomicrobia bacterium 12-59-8]|nr:MAG: hypothetical protein B7Z37_23115 [Verrucomicrobia bacterium 12-59-8]